MLSGLTRIHTDAWRDAARLGLQSSVAAAAAYLASEVAGDLEHFLVIMMAVTALQRTVGGTIGQALVRLQSALAGSVIGLICLALLPSGWGTAVALAVALFVVGAATALRSSWQLAVVPAVGMSLEGPGSLLDTALVTSAGILLGACIGTLVSLLVWPERAEVRFERQFRRALRATATRLSDAVEATVEKGHVPRVSSHVGAWNEAVWLAQEALSDARFVDLERLQARLDRLRDLHESVSILDRAAEAASPPLTVRAMRGRIGGLRRDACALLTALADGHLERAERIASIDETLERLRDAIRSDHAGAEAQELESTVAFGLREVRRTLTALLDGEEGVAAPPAGARDRAA